MKAPQDCFVKIGKVNARYWDVGDQGSPLVLIHGLGGYVENWLPSIDLLAARHRVLAVDLLGHGRTDKPLDVPYKIADMARFIQTFMAELGIPHAQVVGHSLGGWIGLRLTLDHPELVDSLVLVDSAGLGREGSFMLRLLSLPFLGEMLTRPSRSGSRSLYRSLVYDPAAVSDDWVEIDYQMTLLPNSQPAFLKALRAICSLAGQSRDQSAPIVAGLRTIHKPVSVIWGRQDPVVPLAHAQVVTHNLPTARLQVLEHCGHVPQIEQTQAFNQALVGFLQD